MPTDPKRRPTPPPPREPLPERENRPRTDPPGAPDDPDRSVRQRLEALIPELVKRTVSVGVGAVLTTEEGIRKLAQDFSLPKDVANYLITTANTTKDEVFKVFAREIREFLQNVNLNEELQRLLTSLSFEIRTEIRFIPNDEAVGGVKPNMRRRMAIKRRTDSGEVEEEVVEDEVEAEKSGRRTAPKATSEKSSPSS